jgi:hypothetical protein
MKLIKHDLRDKWILESGATTVQPQTQKLLDVMNFPVPSFLLYLLSIEKLMATQIGLVEFSKISFSV